MTGSFSQMRMHPHSHRHWSTCCSVGQLVVVEDEGVLQMSLGEQAVLAVTSDFAYGAMGAGGSIPSDTDLVFEANPRCSKTVLRSTHGRNCMFLLLNILLVCCSESQLR